MSRDITAISQSVIGKLHPGWVFKRRGGLLDSILHSFAGLIHDAERQAESLMDEIDPRNARNLLVDFERVLGPDHCGRDLANLGLSERQQLAHQRWTSTGGQSIPYMISVAAKLGVTVAIDEYWPSKAGRMRAGHRLIPEGSQFVYTFRLEGSRVTKFRAGRNSAGQRLGWFTLSPAECELRRIRPAHTTAIFNYHNTLTWDGDPLTWDDDLLVQGVGDE